MAYDVAAKPGVVKVAVSHRIGKLEIGDVALVVAVSSAHRGDAFARCAELVDDGGDEWVNCP